MSLRTFCFFLIIIFANQIKGQSPDKNIYHKLKINITGRNIQDLTKAGIETDHGIYIKNRFLTSDFNEEEIEIIKSLGFEYEVLIDNVAQYYANPERPSEISQWQLQSRNNCFAPPVQEYKYKTPDQYKPGSMGGYFTLDEMYEILDSMAIRYPKFISKKEAIKEFRTLNGIPIYYIKVSDNVAMDETNEPKVLYTALHHAREPNSLSQMIFFLWYLLENYEKDPMVKKIVDQTQLYFIPCVNPDGYVLNQKNNPNGGGLWRKNTWKDLNGDIKGVDLNRNYGHTWGKDNIGSSPNPNSLTFRGQSAFSEPETQAVRAFCLEHDFKLALNYHTFGNYLIYPFIDASGTSQPELLFKNMGKVLNFENNFALGTDLQTVGYSVNGDSDNWMFGENGEKNRIFAYTPEVGPGFWPASVDIDYLNKSCMWMNMSAALLTLSHYEVEEVRTSNFLDDINKSIQVKVSRTGLQAGEAKITLKPQNNNVGVSDAQRIISLDLGKDTTLTFHVGLNSGQRYEDGFAFDLTISNDGLERTKTIRKNWSEYPFTSIFKDRDNDQTLFQSTGWGLDGSNFVSGPHSISDSPSGPYPAKYKASITLKNPVDLSNVSKALLQFDAKWDIEDNYDYVQVLASKDNKDFIPLCGLYTNPGTENQTLSSPVYDGVQKDWVREEIDLSSFTGTKNLWIRFYIQTDDYEQRDGFYFDNLEIKVATKTSSTDDKLNHSIYLRPNIVSDDNQITVNGLEPNEEYHLEIFDINGRTIITALISDGQHEFVFPDISKGIYFYTISYQKNQHKKILSRGKILKM